MPIEIYNTTPFMDTCLKIYFGGSHDSMTHSTTEAMSESKVIEPSHTVQEVTSGALHAQLLTCAICKEAYNRPKVLPCLHTFCAKCLSDYIPAQSLSVTCFTCRHQSILPEPGVSALQDNHFIINLMAALGQDNSCRDCKKAASFECTRCVVKLCSCCVENHISALTVKDNNEMSGDHSEHDIVPVACQIIPNDNSCEKGSLSNGQTTAMETLVCPSHNGTSLEYYCPNCETAICKICTDGEHSTHLTCTLSAAILEHKSTLKLLLDKTESRLPEVTRAIGLVEEVLRTLSENYEQAKQETNEAFNEAVVQLEKRRETVLTDINTVYERKQTALLSQAGDLTHALNLMRSSCEFTHGALQCGNETEVLLVRKEMSEKLSHLSSQVFQTAPNENPSLALNVTDFSALRKHIAAVGTLLSNSAIAHETTASGESLRKCYVNRCATVNAISKDTHGQLVKVGNAVIEARVTTNSKEDIIIPEIVDHKNGAYDINYSVPEIGVYSLSITLYGQPIKGSPFRIKSYADVDGSESLSSRLSKTPPVKQRGTKRPPSSRSQGSNRKSNTVEDDLLQRIGAKGRNSGQFTNPQGVVVRDDRLLVADSNNQCIQVFCLTGEYKYKFGMRGRQPGQLQRPTGMAVTQNGNLLVADYDNKWICVFSPDGKYLNKIGTGKLLGPKGVMVDRDGRIIVVDNKQSCIVIFQNNGKFLHKFGSRGNQEYQLAGPHFCASTIENDIVISDFHNHCVKVFDSEGRFKFSFGSHGEGNGQFNAPTGVAVDGIGNILVADWGNSRIQVFDRHGSFLSFINTCADPLYGPQGLTVTSDNHVIVADSGNHCIKVYRYLQ